nr:hypothetical protein [Tanacetum cinerariifolium]
MQEDDSEVQEVVEVVTTAKLITDVVTAASQISAASATISDAKPSIPAAALTVVAAYIRRRKGVIIRDPKKELSSKNPTETPKLKDKGKEVNKDHEEINKDIDWDAAIDHVKQKSKNPQYIKRYQVMKKIPQTKSEAHKNMMIYLKKIAGYKLDFFKGMPEEIEEEDQEVLKSINETPAQKAAKRRKLNEEAQEAKDLKKRLEVVDDEDDDAFTEATPLARKVPVMDYQIVLINNKPRFKIIKADETHQLYISFITLLNNFDREYLENLWGIVKEIFSTSKPTNFSDEYLLTTLKTMYEKPDGQDAVWKCQRSVHDFGVDVVEEIRKNTKCVNAANEELTAAKHKLMLLVYCCGKDNTAAEELMLPRVETPLFKNMLAVRDVDEEKEAQVPAQGDEVQEPAAEEVTTEGRISVDMDQDEGIELVVDHEKDAEVEGRQRSLKDKGKGILIEDPKPLKKKDQVEMDAEYAKKLHEELDKEHEEAYKQIDWSAALDHV